jgi:uncharacterized Zn finger protein
MGYWNWYPKSKPRRPANGIRAKTERGQFGKSWWASKWIAALDRLVDTGRLSRGRTYARSGQVLNIEIQPGRVDSRVQGSRPQPYKVWIKIKPLSNREWAKVTKAMASQAIFAAKLLGGEMPQNIEQAFKQAKVSLFPTKSGDLDTNCSCPDYANPCKHIAAVYYLLGEQFDENPFLIFQLRGRTKAQIMAALHAARVAGAAEPAPARKRVERKDQSAAKVKPLNECLNSFWEASDELETLSFVIAAPPIEAAPVKRLGEPPFWQDRPGLLPQMETVYRAITKAVMTLTLGK